MKSAITRIAYRHTPPSLCQDTQAQPFRRPFKKNEGEQISLLIFNFPTRTTFLETLLAKTLEKGNKKIVRVRQIYDRHKWVEPAKLSIEYRGIPTNGTLHLSHARFVPLRYRTAAFLC